MPGEHWKNNYRSLGSGSTAEEVDCWKFTLLSTQRARTPVYQCYGCSFVGKHHPTTTLIYTSRSTVISCFAKKGLEL